MATASPRTVEAAGCVVWRREGERVEVLLVHRPHPHDDWSLPKGKLDRGETHAVAAVREVHEETGVVGELGARLGEVRYELPDGRHKHVRFWALEAEREDPWQPGAEIDDREWLGVAEAAGRLTWSSDRGVLAAFSQRAGAGDDC